MTGGCGSLVERVSVHQLGSQRNGDGSEEQTERATGALGVYTRKCNPQGFSQKMLQNRSISRRLDTPCNSKSSDVQPMTKHFKSRRQLCALSSSKKSFQSGAARL